MNCTHHWTTTSECPYCLRDWIDRAQAVLYRPEMIVGLAMTFDVQPPPYVGQPVSEAIEVMLAEIREKLKSIPPPQPPGTVNDESSG